MDIVLKKRDLNGQAAVYVAWGARRECLYVGMTSQGFLRPLTNTTLRAVWDKLESIAIEWCANSDIARSRERELISKLNPLLNRVGKLAMGAREALTEAKQDKAAAARIMGVSRATLYRRLKECGA